MNNNIRKLPVLVLSLTAVLAFSCSKDKQTQENKPENYLSAENIRAPLSSAAVKDRGDGIFDLTILSDGLSLSSDNTLTGKGHLIYFKIHSSGPSGIVPGIYTYAEQDGPAGTFGYSSEVLLNRRIPDEYYGLSLLIVGGVLKVGREGANYVFDVSGILENGTGVTAHYTGSVGIIDPDES